MLRAKFPQVNFWPQKLTALMSRYNLTKKHTKAKDFLEWKENFTASILKVVVHTAGIADICCFYAFIGLQIDKGTTAIFDLLEH